MINVNKLYNMIKCNNPINVKHKSWNIKINKIYVNNLILRRNIYNKVMINHYINLMKIINCKILIIRNNLINRMNNKNYKIIIQMKILHNKLNKNVNQLII